MKNICAALLLLFVSGTANAQFAIEGGLNMANMSIKQGDNKLKTAFNTGAAFGILDGINIDGHVYFEPGFFFATAGCKITGTPSGAYDLTTLTFPLNIQYKSGDKCGTRWLLGAGPYICKLMSGTYTLDAVYPMPAVSGSLSIGTDIKSVDYGIGVNAGYQLRQHFYLRAHYQMGLANLNPSNDSKNTIKTSALGVTIGYAFSGCRSGGGRGHGRDYSHWRGIKKGRDTYRMRNYHAQWIK